MKRNLTIQIFSLLFLILGVTGTVYAQDPSAIMELESTTQGALVPRMATAERETIPSPAQGLLVYDTDSGSFWYYEDMKWNELGNTKELMLVEGGESSVGVIIPDGDPLGIGDTIVLVDTGLISPETEIRVCMNINHPYLQDVDVILWAPDGLTSIILTDDNPGYSPGYVSTCFSYRATISIVNGSPPYTGTFLPEGLFSDFIGQSIAGEWILQVLDDDAIVDAGTFVDWSIDIVRGELQIANELADTDMDTKIYTEKSIDEDVIRFEVAGHEFLQLGDTMATFDGDVKADTFYGDGSKLTGIMTGGGGGGCTLYGDGSAGNLVISANTDWSIAPPSNGNFFFTDLTINAGVTLSVVSGTILTITGTLTNNGTILVLPGYPGETSANHPSGAFPGAVGKTLSRSMALDDQQLAFLTTPGLFAGSNGGNGSGTATPDMSGGSGGGTLVLRAETQINNSGTISADGGDGTLTPVATSAASGCSGGGGGFVILMSNSIVNSGTIDVSGGNGGSPGAADDDHSGGGGGGGLIHLISPNANSVVGTLNVNGGLKGPDVPVANVGTSGNAGGASAGNGGAGGTDVMGNPIPIPAENGENGLIFRTQVPDPCFVKYN